MEKFEYDKYLLLRNNSKNIVNKISFFRLLVFLLIVISFILGANNNIFNFVGIGFIIVFIVLIFVHDKYYKKLSYYENYLLVLDKYKARFNGEWKKFDDMGREYSNELFDDLNIVGPNSLFQYLSVCKTKGGRDNLIDKLSNKKITTKKLLENQEAIKELASTLEFDVNFLVAMGDYDSKLIDLKDNFDILDKKVGNKRIELFLGVGCSLVCILFFVLSFFKIISYNYFTGMFIFNFLVNFMYSFIYHEEFDNINKVSDDYYKLSSVYKLIGNYSFLSRKLVNIKKDVDDGAGRFKYLFFINDLNNLKNNILSSFIFNGLFCINMIVAFMYSVFQNGDTVSIKRGILGVEEIEALISLAGIGIFRKDVCMPVVVNDVKLEFKNLRHPLIDEDICVGNDFSDVCGVNIITGSNMGGKTTFIRTIGINLILMNAGTFVCGSVFNSCYFKIFTSISVNDNIDKGISTFYGELLRMKEAIDYDRGNRLVLVDEIFKGTNYNDRIYGATSVIKKLDDKKTILFVTTHDFELCDYKVLNLKNYYFKEYYEDDNIRFDYKLRDGKCNSTNAKYLMKKLNIIDD